MAVLGSPAPPTPKRGLVESVLRLSPNAILELGLRIATGLLITFAAGLVLLAAEVRFGVQPEALNLFCVEYFCTD
jgi:hypothetical protein